MPLNRREFCQTAATALLAGAAFGIGTSVPLSVAFAQDAAVADLAVAGPLGDMVMGDDKAPVTIVEYASMTCSHCAHFQATTFPELKKRYIDTGKVRYIMREFPLDPLAAAGFMLARCAGKDDKNKYFALVDTLFLSQSTWVVQKPLDPLKTISKQAGLSDKDFDACLANQQLLDGIEAVRQRGSEKFGVNSTPTFFINGKKQSGDISIDEMDKLIQPYLKS